MNPIFVPFWTMQVGHDQATALTFLGSLAATILLIAYVISLAVITGRIVGQFYEYWLIGPPTVHFDRSGHPVKVTKSGFPAVCGRWAITNAIIGMGVIAFWIGIPTVSFMTVFAFGAGLFRPLCSFVPWLVSKIVAGIVALAAWVKSLIENLYYKLRAPYIARREKRLYEERVAFNQQLLKDRAAERKRRGY